MTDQNQLLREALEEIALAGMSGTGQESEEAMNAWHARQAWKFIGIAARALDAHKKALAQPAPGVPTLSKDQIREVFLSHGFTIKEGQTDLKPYVYDAADALLKLAYAALAAQPVEGGEVADYKALYEDAMRASNEAGFVGLDAAATIRALSELTTPPASLEQAQQPSTQAWANETGLRQIECPSCGDLAVAYDPQQPSPATPADMAVYQSIADGYTKAQQPIGDVVAHVPIHPRQGPLWANVRPVGAETPMPSYKTRPLTYTDATPAPKAEPVRPLFAASVAARKWADLQADGHRMQSIAFDGGPGGPGTIDPWGKVTWGATPKPEPMTDEALWEMWVDSPSDVLAFARRIEAHHGITAQGAQEGV